MPRILGPLPANKAERQLYNAFASQLPSDWVVLASVCWSERQRGAGPGRASWVRDGEADFVVIAPGLGLCVAEVKGSRFIRVRSDGRWYRSRDRHSWVEITPKIPPEQATSNAHQIARMVRDNLGWSDFPFNYGYVVVYPNGTIAEGELQTFDPSVMVFKDQMDDLASRIRRALSARGPEENNEALTADLANRIGEMLMNHPLEIAPADTAEEAQADAETIDRLTRQQFAALQGIFRHPRVAVTGPAGSGKTVLAVWRLAALVEQGEDALFLCYNKRLARHLKLEHPELAPQIWNADRYFSRLVRQRPRPGQTDLDKFFEEELPGLVIDKMENLPDDQKVDALIVDEGQDFGEFRLWAAQTLLREGGSYLYCSDDRQDLYKRATRSSVGAEVVFSLVHNCRNTKTINETSNKAIDEHVQPMPGLPEGVPTEIRHVEGPRAMAKAAWGLVGDWAAPGTRVAILSPYKLDKSCMATVRKGYNKELATSLEVWDDSTVMFSTIKSFKGLEADVVIVVDVVMPREGSALEKEDLYVAFTRPRARLAVLCSDQAACTELST